MPGGDGGDLFGAEVVEQDERVVFSGSLFGVVGDQMLSGGALAWLLAKGDDIAPIPGTKHVDRLEENVAADTVQLTPRQIARLDNLTPPAGHHHNEAQARMLER